MCIQQILAINLRELYEKATGHKVVMYDSLDSTEWYLDHSCVYTQERRIRIALGPTRIEIYKLDRPRSRLGVYTYESPTLVDDLISELLRTEY